MSLTNLDINKRRRLYVTGGVESTFGTAGTFTHCFLSLLTGNKPLRPVQKKISDRDYTAGGIRTDLPTSHLPVGYDFPATAIPVLATLEGVAMAFAKVIGHCTTASIGGGLYSHTIPGGLPAGDTPAFDKGSSLEEHMSGAVAVADSDYRFLGMQFEEAVLSWGETDLATLTFTVIGSGKHENAAIVSEAGLIIPQTFFTGKQIRPWYLAASGEHTSAFDGHEVGATAWTFGTLNAGATALGDHVIAGELRVKANHGARTRQGQAIGSGLYEGQRFQGVREASLKLTLRIDDTTRPLLKEATSSTAAAQNEYTVGLDIMGQTDGHGDQLVLCLTDPPEVDGGDGPGESIREFTFNARKVTAGTDRPLISIYSVNTENIDYADVV